MSSAAGGNNELLFALDQLLAKYFDEKDGSAREKTSLDKFWGTYSRAMQDEDEARPKDWDGNTGSILTFTGLFAATVAAFVIESYKSLSPDSGDRTVALLTQILAASTNASSSPVIGPTLIEPFHAPMSAIIANALWFCSLVVALACALLATLVQQWSRDYVRDIKQRDILDESMTSRALNHVYIRMGVDRYGMDGVVNVIVALVHLAVMLFAAGLLLFLFPINDAISWCTVSALAIFGAAYLIASVLPIFDTSCPYKTPLTYPLSLVHLFLVRISHVQIPRKRRIPRRMFDFMSFPRFQFIWNHTSRHLLLSTDGTSTQTLVDSMSDILANMHDPSARDAAIDVLLNDSLFSYRLDHVRLSDTSDSGRLRDTSLNMACLLLQKCYLRKDTWDIDDWKTKLSEYLRVILSSSYTPGAHDHQHTPVSLRASLALLRVRWFLLLDCETTSYIGSDFSIAEFDALYFAPESKGGHWRSRVLHDQRMIEYPETLLILMNSRLYNRLETPSTRVSEHEDAGSCLVPLHDGDCCTSRNGPSTHVAACTVLTLITHILRAWKHSDRDPQLIDTLYYDVPLWDRGISFTNWHRVFKMSDAERHCAPSDQFIAVLRDAGLDEWMGPGGNIAFQPSPRSPMGRLLYCVIDPHAPDVTLVDVLRTLAMHVDLSGARSDHDRDPPLKLLEDSVPAPSTSREEGRYNAADHSVNATSAERYDTRRSAHDDVSIRLQEVVVERTAVEGARDG
ncbi:unnamed protein product [Peniophora sp. CBMAI 1063]|nr:unnamed protein product [Peniophora sp. CBMAI 1063]